MVPPPPARLFASVIPLESDSDSQVDVASVGLIQILILVRKIQKLKRRFQSLLWLWSNVDLEDEFLSRAACEMQCVPAFLRGLYRASMRLVLIEADNARGK